MTGLSVNRTQKRAISPVARSQFCHSRLREFVVCSQDIILGLGNDLRVRSLPLSEEFIYLSLAAEIEPEGRCFAGTLESAGGVLSWRFERYPLVPGCHTFLILHGIAETFGLDAELA